MVWRQAGCAALLIFVTALGMACGDRAGAAANPDTSPAILDTQVDTAEVSPCRLPPTDTPEPGETTALYALGDDPSVPFPSDLFTRPDPGSPTGLRLEFGPTNTMLFDSVLGFFLPVAETRALLGGMEGFGTFSPILFGFSGPLEAGLGGDSADAPIFMVKLNEDGTCAERIPVFLSTMPTQDLDGPLTLLVIDPQRPLAKTTTYAAVVTRSLLDASGEPIVPHPHFRHLTGCGGENPTAGAVTQHASDLLDRLRCLEAVEPPLCPCDLAAATVFTTADTPATALGIRDSLAGPDAPALELSLDPDGDGELDLFPPADTPRFPGSVQEFPHSSVSLRGTFDVPDFRGDDQDVLLDATDRPTEGGTLRIPFALLLPADPTLQPFKVVVMSHGNGGEKERIGHLAETFGEAGLALAAIDAIGHGELEGYGTFLSADLLQTRGCFIQTQANTLRFFQALHALEDLDVFPPGAPDGIPDLDLSAGLGFIGESLGGLTGMVAVAMDPRVRAAVINVAGGGVRSFATEVVGSLIPAGNELLLWSFQALVQTVMERIDPIAFVSHILDPPGERRVLMQAVVGDPLFGGASTWDLARALSLPSVCPCPLEVPHLPTVEAPYLGNGLVYWDDTGHGFLLVVDEDNPEATDGVRRQAAWFLRTALEAEAGEILHPFAAR